MKNLWCLVVLFSNLPISNPQVKLICLPHQVCQTSAASNPSDIGCLSEEEFPPFPPFLARCKENRRKTLARDTLYPTIKQCAWRTYTDLFSTVRVVCKFSFITTRLFNDMRIFQTNQPVTRIVQNLLESSRLLPTVVEIEPYVQEIIKEFYANIGSIEFLDCGRHCVFVRGTMFKFTPQIINELFHLP